MFPFWFCGGGHVAITASSVSGSVCEGSKYPSKCVCCRCWNGGLLPQLPVCSHWDVHVKSPRICLIQVQVKPKGIRVPCSPTRTHVCGASPTLCSRVFGSRVVFLNLQVWRFGNSVQAYRLRLCSRSHQARHSARPLWMTVQCDRLSSWSSSPFNST